MGQFFFEPKGDENCYRISVCAVKMKKTNSTTSNEKDANAQRPDVFFLLFFFCSKRGWEEREKKNRQKTAYIN